MLGAVWAREAREDLVEVLWRYSPSVERVSEDRALVDLGGVKLDLPFAARVGVASNRFVAHLASIAGMRVEVGEEERFVADFRLSVLPVEEETLRRLELLGFARLGQLRELSIEDLVLQFGEEGELIWELCRGIDETPLSPEPLPDLLEATFEVENVGGPWLDELFGRLRDRGELCVQMVVGGVEVNFSRPTADPKRASKLFFERLAGEALEESERVRVVISHTVKGRAEQLGFFSNSKQQIVEAMETKRPIALMRVVWDDPKCRLYERRAHLQSLMCEETQRPLCLPRPLKRGVAEVLNRWEVEEDWWTETPIARSYQLVLYDNGAPGRIFYDRKAGTLFNAMP